MTKFLSPVAAFFGLTQSLIVNFFIQISPNSGGNASPDFDWVEWKKLIKVRHYFLAILALVSVVGSYYLLYHMWPGANYSLILILAEGISWIANQIGLVSIDLTSYLFVSFLLIIVLSPRKVMSIPGDFVSISQSLPQLAMREEVIFRANSESWTLLQRTRSSLAFGAAHFGMLIVPVGLIPGLTLTGVLFMLCYLVRYRKTGSSDEALLEAATLHTAYNSLALTFLVVLVVAMYVRVITLLV